MKLVDRSTFISINQNLVFLKGEKEEGFMEDDQGVMVAKRPTLEAG